MALTSDKLLRYDTNTMLTNKSNNSNITLEKERNLTCKSYTEISDREKWLFDNKEALTAVQEGLKQSATGKVKRRGSFAKFVNDEIDIRS